MTSLEDVTAAGQAKILAAAGIPRDAGHPVRYHAHNLLSALVNWAGERMLRGTPYDGRQT